MSTLAEHDKEQTALFKKAEKPKMPSGKIETRAKVFAQNLASFATSEKRPATFHIRWRKSSQYGWNPIIEDQAGDRCTDVSGAGYDKLSACLSSFLHWIFPDQVNLGNGQGVRCVIERMKDRGWILEHTLADNELDIFTLAPVPEVLPDPATLDPQPDPAPAIK